MQATMLTMRDTITIMITLPACKVWGACIHLGKGLHHGLVANAVQLARHTPVEPVEELELDAALEPLLRQLQRGGGMRRSCHCLCKGTEVATDHTSKAALLPHTWSTGLLLAGW